MLKVEKSFLQTGCPSSIPTNSINAEGSAQLEINVTHIRGLHSE